MRRNDEQISEAIAAQIPKAARVSSSKKIQKVVHTNS
jgi:hypothetical protein